MTSETRSAGRPPPTRYGIPSSIQIRESGSIAWQKLHHEAVSCASFDRQRPPDLRYHGSSSHRYPIRAAVAYGLIGRDSPLKTAIGVDDLSLEPQCRESQSSLWLDRRVDLWIEWPTRLENEIGLKLHIDGHSRRSRRRHRYRNPRIRIPNVRSHAPRINEPRGGSDGRRFTTRGRRDKSNAPDTVEVRYWLRKQETEKVSERAYKLLRWMLAPALPNLLRLLLPFPSVEAELVIQRV